VEIGATISSLDPAVAASNSQEAAKAQLEALIYDHRNPDKTFAGAGAFRVSAWEPGKSVTLAANDDYRGGRPFVDSIEIQMGRSARDRLLDIELNKTDFAEIPAEQARHASERGVRTSTSQPDELLALVFVTGHPVAENMRMRGAMARAIDRAAIVNFILQKTGEPAGGLLPQWSSGTAFLFSTAADVARAKELSSQITPSPRLVLGYDFADPLEHSVAERIVVNAREAGITVTPDPIQRSASPQLDARLERWRMESQHPRESLANFIETLRAESIDSGEACESLPEPATPEQIYACERGIISSYRVVPLVWLPQVYGLSARVRDWKAPAPGEGWALADVWLDGEAP
jgi:peptide/nickel transport system substrate-binding protein